MYSRIACRPGVGPPPVTLLPVGAPGCSLGLVHPELCLLARLPSPVAPCTMLHSPCTFVSSLCPLGAAFRPPRPCSSAGIRRADAQRDHRPGPRVCSYAGAIGHRCACASLDGRPDSCRVLRPPFALRLVFCALACPAPAPTDALVPHGTSTLALATVLSLSHTCALACFCLLLRPCPCPSCCALVHASGVAAAIYIYHGWLVLVAADQVRFCGRPSDDGLTGLHHLKPLPLPLPRC